MCECQFIELHHDPAVSWCIVACKTLWHWASFCEVSHLNMKIMKIHMLQTQKCGACNSNSWVPQDPTAVVLRLQCFDTLDSVLPTISFLLKLLEKIWLWLQTYLWLYYTLSAFIDISFQAVILLHGHVNCCTYSARFLLTMVNLKVCKVFWSQKDEV